MKRIPSFCVDHTKLQPGIYTSRIDDDIVTYDIRMKKPNVPPFLPVSYTHLFSLSVSNFNRSSFPKTIIKPTQFSLAYNAHSVLPPRRYLYSYFHALPPVLHKQSIS